MLKSASLAIMAAMAGGVIWLPAAHAGDLGDGGYGPRAYGHHAPYFSGQGDDQDYAYRQNDDDDDDDHVRRNDDDDDDDQDNRSYRDQNDDDDDVIVRPRRGIYSDRGDGDDDRRGCVPGWRVKQRLTGEGWTNFHLDSYGRGIALVRATRGYTGHRFLLRIDRCSGQTISSVPLGRQYSMRD